MLPNETKFGATDAVSLQALRQSYTPGDVIARQTARMIADLETASEGFQLDWSTFELHVERGEDAAGYLIQRATVIGMRN